MTQSPTETIILLIICCVAIVGWDVASIRVASTRVLKILHAGRAIGSFILISSATILVVRFDHLTSRLTDCQRSAYHDINTCLNMIFDHQEALYKEGLVVLMATGLIIYIVFCGILWRSREKH